MTGSELEIFLKADSLRRFKDHASEVPQALHGDVYRAKEALDRFLSEKDVRLTREQWDMLTRARSFLGSWL